MKPITINKGWSTCKKQQQKRKTHSLTSSKIVARTSLKEKQTQRGEGHSFNYSINKVFLRRRMRDEASLEIKCPSNHKNGDNAAWESCKNKQWKWWKWYWTHTQKQNIQLKSSLSSVLLYCRLQQQQPQ